MRLFRDPVLLVLLAFGGWASPSAAAGEAAKPCYVAMWLSTEPELDGLTDDDPAWTAVPENRGAFYVLGTKTKAPLQTTFRVAYTVKGIYAAVACAEPNVDGIQAEHGDMGPLWEEDSVEIFLSPAGTREILHLICSAVGSRFNDSYAGGEGQASWEARTFFGQDGWSAEVFIPYATLGHFPEKGAHWGFSVCRNICTLEEKLHTTWMPCPGRRYLNSVGLQTISFSGGLNQKEKRAVERRLRDATRARSTAVRERFVVVRRKSGMYLLRPGGGSELLARLSGPHIAPRLMPDGEHVLFHSRKGGAMGTWRLAIKDKSVERLCDGDQAACRADGKRIVFCRDGTIFERELATGREQAVSPEGWTVCRFPGYLPDGPFDKFRTVVPSSSRGDGRVTFVIEGDPDGVYATGRERQNPILLFEGDIRSAPRSSPDGRWLACSEGAHIWLLDLVSGLRRQLTTAGGVQTSPVWSSDSKSLCFCQAPDPFADSHTLYHVKLDSPEVFGRVLSKIECAPDWSGTSPRVVKSTRLPEEGLWVLAANKAIPLPPADALFADERFRALPAPGLELSREVVVRNRLAALCISAKNNRLLLVFKTDGRPAEVRELVPFDAQGRAMTGIQAVAWRERTVERAGLTVTFTCEKTGVVAPAGCAVDFILPRARPTLTVRPVRDCGGVWVRGRLNRVVVQDRFADDLVFEPGAYVRSPVALPYAPVLFGSIPSGDCLLMAITPHFGQAVRLTKDRGRGHEAFSMLRIRAAGKPFHLSALTGPGIWRRLSLVPDGKPGQWSAPWSAPFKGRWRVVTETNKGAYSAMVNIQGSVKRLKLSVAPQDFEAGPPVPALVYPHGRNSRSALSALTPMDVLYDALGPKRAEAVLDIHGIRGCRAADAYTPFKDYRVTLKVISWIDINQDGARESVRHLCDDLVNMMQALDGRIAEYKSLMDRLERLCREGKVEGPITAGQLEAAAGKIADPETPFARFRRTAEALKRAAETLGARKEHRAKKKELETVCGKAFPERVRCIAQYRRLARNLRNAAGLAVAAHPESRALFERLRETIRLTLRNRYFLEADWRGEEPLNPERVDYEKIKDR